MDHHALTVDIADLELPKLVTAQAGGIKSGDDGPVFQVDGVI